MTDPRVLGTLMNIERQISNVAKACMRISDAAEKAVLVVTPAAVEVPEDEARSEQIDILAASSQELRLIAESLRHWGEQGMPMVSRETYQSLGTVANRIENVAIRIDPDGMVAT